MTTQTKLLIETAFKCDGTITADERRAIDALLAGRKDEPGEELLPIPEVARRLHKTPKTIHLYCKQGILRKVSIGNNSRASGVLASSVAALLKGGAA